MTMEMHDAIQQVMTRSHNVRSWYLVDYQDIRSIVNGYFKNREIITEALALSLGESFGQVEEAVYKVMSDECLNRVRYEEFTAEDWRRFRDLFVVADVMEDK